MKGTSREAGQLFDTMVSCGLPEIRFVQNFSLLKIHTSKNVFAESQKLETYAYNNTQRDSKQKKSS